MLLEHGPFPPNIHQNPSVQESCPIPQQVIELHLDTWKQEVTEKGSGLWSRVSQMERKGQNVRDKGSSSLWWNLAVLQPGSWRLPQPRKWGKQARQLVECQVPLKRLEWFQMIAICSGAQWSLDGGQRFMVRLRPGRLAQSQSSQCSLCLDADGSFHSPYLLLKHSDYHHGCSLLKSQGPSLFSLTPGPLPILPCTSRMPVNGSNDREDESGQVSWG